MMPSKTMQLKISETIDTKCLEAIIVGVFHIKHMCSFYASYQYNTVVSNPCPGGGGGGLYMSCLTYT